MTAQKPILGITMGDPAGVGPEIAVKALAEPDVYDICRPLVVGDAGLPGSAFTVAQVHAQQHLGPVTRLRPARAGVDADDGTAVIARP